MSLRHAILGVLMREPMHGYRIRAEIERRLAGGRHNSAQIYQGLRWLAEHDLIAAVRRGRAAGRGRRPFRITRKGANEFKRWLSAPLAPYRPPRSEMMVKLAFFGRRNMPQLIDALEHLRRQQIRRLASVEARLRRVSERETDASPFAQLAGAALRFREEAELHWIDHCLQHLSRSSAKLDGGMPQ